MSSSPYPSPNSHVKSGSILEIKFGDAQNSNWKVDFKPRFAITGLNDSHEDRSCELMQVSPSGTSKVFGHGSGSALSNDSKDKRLEVCSQTSVQQLSSPFVALAAQSTINSPNALDLPYEHDNEPRGWSPSSGRLIDTETDRCAAAPVSSNEKNVVRAIYKSINRLGKRSRQYGRIYAIRDTVNDLVKIGSTTKEEGDRLNSWIKKCKYPFGQLKLLAATAEINVSTQDYKRLEHLIHCDLAPHRRYFMCPCGGTKLEPRDVRHKEWFKVCDEEVLKTMKVWYDFILQEPYIAPTATLEGHLKLEWYDRLEERDKVDSKETHDNHDIRIAR